MGHYPWFLTYNYLNSKVPAMSGVKGKLRSAGIGFFSSMTSDIISNGVRVVKTAKQTSLTDLGYFGTAAAIISTDGVSGLVLRGLGTKLLSNGLQAMLFNTNPSPNPNTLTPTLTLTLAVVYWMAVLTLLTLTLTLPLQRAAGDALHHLLALLRGEDCAVAEAQGG